MAACSDSRSEPLFSLPSVQSPELGEQYFLDQYLGQAISGDQLVPQMDYSCTVSTQASVISSSNSIQLQCKDCNKIFHTRSRYNRHRNTHIRPYKCLEIGCQSMPFANRQDLLRHQRSRHASVIPQYFCHVPGCSYSRQGLRGAVLRKDNLLRHVRRAHPDNHRHNGDPQPTLHLYDGKSDEESRDHAELATMHEPAESKDHVTLVIKRIIDEQSKSSISNSMAHIPVKCTRWHDIDNDFIFDNHEDFLRHTMAHLLETSLNNYSSTETSWLFGELYTLYGVLLDDVRRKLDGETSVAPCENNIVAPTTSLLPPSSRSAVESTLLPIDPSLMVNTSQSQYGNRLMISLSQHGTPPPEKHGRQEHLVQSAESVSRSESKEQVQYKATADSELQAFKVFDDERRAIIEWLSPLEFSKIQNDTFSKHQPGTGEWLLQSDVFIDWISGTGRILWCPGNPGAGKTVLTSIVVNYLHNQFKSTSDVGIAYIYCNYKIMDTQKPINLIASIWMQLVMEREHLPTDVKALYKVNANKGIRPTLREVLNILQSEVIRYSKVYVVVDALDECCEANGSRLSVLTALRTLQPIVNLMVTSRFAETIAHEFRDTKRLEISAKVEDVLAYVSDRVSRNSRLSKFVVQDATLGEDIQKIVVGNTQTMFLLARLYMDLLASKHTSKAVRKALETLPKDLDSMYDQVMQRIHCRRQGDVQLAERVLSWISFAMRPLTLDEIQNALAIRPNVSEIDNASIPDRELLLSVCEGLVVIDQDISTVRLVHFTVEEYFRRTRTDRFPDAQVSIATACLTYLSFDTFAEGPCVTEADMRSRLLKYPLLGYASRYWGDHIRGDPENSLGDLIIGFLHQKSTLHCAVQALQVSRYRSSNYTAESSTYANALYVSAYFGLKNIVTRLLENREEIRAHGDQYGNALQAAASNGHLDVVEMLLAMGADVNTPASNGGWTALQAAAEGGYLDVVETLLAAGADVNTLSGNGGWTALQAAVACGHTAVVGMLLETDAKQGQSSHALKKPSSKGLSILVSPDNPSLDIVFIHGLTGHPTYTWCHKAELMEDQFGREAEEGGEHPAKFSKVLPSISSHNKRSGIRKAVFWPQDLIPITAPHARVFTYGYDTNTRGSLGPVLSMNNVYDIAQGFLVSMEAVRRSEPLRPLLFIAHSLGGIIVTEALRISRGCEIYQSHLHNIFESTAGIIFFGTPHGGADPRGLFQHISEKVIKIRGFTANAQVLKPLLPSSEQLKTHEEFGLMARQKNWIIYSFQEQYGVTSLSSTKAVEDAFSCLNNPNIEVTQHIASNHIDMCRFSGADDPEYAKVVTALIRVLERIDNSTILGGRPETIAGQRRIILDSLRFNQIDTRQTTIKTVHDNTCEWLLETPEYQEWLNPSKSFKHYGFLWIKGKPGAGKSTLMKFALAQAKKTMTNTTIISFFFNARGADLEKSTVGMYRSLLVQLMEKVPRLQSMLDMLRSALPSKSDSYKWDIEILKDLFCHVIEELGQQRLTCFIDALDECEEDQIRDMVAVFEHLGQNAFSAQVQFRVCFSCRHYPHITVRKGLQLILECQEGHNKDIIYYLRSKLTAGHSKQVEQARAEIIKKASGVFLWVVLVVEMLNKEYDQGRIHTLRKRLQEIPAELSQFFQVILTRDRQNMEELLLCLEWILYAKRPLKQEELYFAILSGVEPKCLTAWNLEEITDQDIERFILSSSKGFAEVTKSKDHTVQFVHETVKDFLLKENGLDLLWSGSKTMSPTLSHERLKQCCLRYTKIDTSEHLLSMQLPNVSPIEAANLRQLAFEKFPFLEYAVSNVLYHADVAEGGQLSQRTFLEHFPLGDWITLNNLVERYRIRHYTPSASLLYILAERDLPNLVRIQLNRVSNMDIIGERYCFPIFAALANGNENVVRELLRQDAQTLSNSDMPHDVDSQYHQNLLKLIENRRDIKSPNSQTLLSYAAERGDIPIVKLLLATKKVDLDARDEHGRTPLSLAAENGHEAVVTTLLATRKVDLDARDENGRTPLSLAAENGHRAVVTILLTNKLLRA